SGESLAESSTTFIPETSDGETQLTYTVDVDNHGDVPRNQNNGIITLITIFIGYIVFGLLLYRCINNFLNKSNANKQEFDDNIYDDAEDNYNDEYEEDYKYDDYIVDITTRDYTLLNGKKQN
ncbi:MAG: hypothetical protein VZS44_10590, partial [Bacilli bacterium]|nr:hypothetical protein [Bacilli bacterium]